MLKPLKCKGVVDDVLSEIMFPYKYIHTKSYYAQNQIYMYIYIYIHIYACVVIKNVFMHKQIKRVVVSSNWIGLFYFVLFLEIPLALHRN